MNNVALLSTSYSGSTLVSMLVCSHPNVIGFGDTYNYQFVRLSDTSCTCGARPSVSCPARIRIENQLIAEGDRFRWLTSNPTPIPEFLASNRNAAEIFRKERWIQFYRQLPKALRVKLLSGYYRQNTRFFEALKILEGKTHYFDGCKSLVRVELLKTIFPDMKIVHLIKNPKAYLHSFLRRENQDYRKIVDGWVRYHTDSKNLGSVLGPESYMLVTFEELTKMPEDCLKTIYRFMGLPERQEPFDQWVDLKSVHVVGSRSKNVFKQVEEKVPKWKSELGIEQIKYINRKVEAIGWLQPILPRLDWT
jgi:hypothetical protein